MVESPWHDDTIREACGVYAEALGAMRRGLSIRAFAAEVGIDASTASRLLRGGEKGSAPSMATHLRLVNYARSRNLTGPLGELESSWRILARRSPESDFERVFGREIAQGQVALVFPLFRLNPRRIREDDEVREEPIYLKARSQASAGLVPEIEAASSHDLGGLLAIVRMLGLNAPGPESIESDVEFTLRAKGSFSQIPRSAFAFGLYSNTLTESYTNSNQPLFTMIPPGEQGSQGAIVAESQCFEQASSGEYPTFFVIARILPDRATNPERVCFICAGTNAAGTHAAGLYLAEDWEWFSRFDPASNFAAIYHVRQHADDPALQLVKATPSPGGRGST